MDDATFLRNLARRSRVVLLADGTAVPAPISVMEDEARAGAAFRIALISPEEIESGDRRTFRKGTVSHRDLPLPLLWQWQLDDGHKTAVVVGRIDHIEQVEDGLGNARGVFDTGPWGREAERMVRAGMLRGVSGDYSNFSATILEKNTDPDEAIKDDKISVDHSKLVAATIVAKPAFENCYIEIYDDDQTLPDGVIEAYTPMTASALRAGGLSEMVARLEQLEHLEYEYMTLTASAASERVNLHRLERERRAAVARMRAARNVTAGFKGMSSNWLSNKAKLQPRDKLGRWIEVGSSVRWQPGKQRHAGVQRGGKNAGWREPYKQGRVASFNANTGEYEIQPMDGSPVVKLKGADVEVVKAVIPDSPDEATKIHAGMPDGKKVDAPDAPDAPDVAPAAPETPDAPDAPDKSPNPDAPTVTPEEMVTAGEEHKKNLTDAIAASKSDDPKIKEVGLDRLSELMGAEIESGDEPFQTNREIARADKQQAKDIARQAENERDAGEWMSREDMGRSLFNNVGNNGDTWEEDSEKYMRAGDKLRKLANSRLISKQRRQWIKDTYGSKADPIADKKTRTDKSWSETFADRKDAPTSPAVPEAPSEGDGNKNLWDEEPDDTSVDLWGDPVGDAPEPDAPAADTEPDEVKPATPAQDLWKRQVEAQVDAIKAQNASKANAPDPKTAFSKPLQKGESINLNQQARDIAKQQALQKLESGETKINGDTRSPQEKLASIAKTMFENLHPELSWGEADQDVWLKAAQKAMETKND